MKLRVLTASITATALLAFVSFNIPEKDILGSWKVAPPSIPNLVKHVLAKAVAAAPDAEEKIMENKGVITELVKSLQVTYNADGSYESASTQGLKNGKWQLMDKGHNLQITKADGSTRKDSVLELSSAKMRLLNHELNDTTLYIRP